jgi:hypothetical protein
VPRRGATRIAARNSERRRMAVANGWSSGFEEEVAAQLDAASVPYEYESERVEYVQEHSYTIDFTIRTRKGDRVFVETKGYFTPADRGKMLRVKKQHPDLDIRLLFQNANRRLSSKSKTTYGEWATKHGFIWATGKVVPPTWYDA